MEGAEKSRLAWSQTEGGAGMSSAQELFEPGEYLDCTRREGYFTICGTPEGKWREAHHELRFLPAVVNGVNPFIDTWITQAVFNGRNRRAVNVRDVGLLFADLDTYHRPDLAGTPEERVE